MGLLLPCGTVGGLHFDSVVRADGRDYSCGDAGDWTDSASRGCALVQLPLHGERDGRVGGDDCAIVSDRVAGLPRNSERRDAVQFFDRSHGADSPAQGSSSCAG
jgi:hypothetical protein